MAEKSDNMEDPQKTGLPSGEPDRSLRISIWDGVFSALHAAVTGGALVPAYALMLGANDFHLGLLAAMMSISTIGGVLSSRLVSSFGHRKQLTITTALAGRVLWALFCALPFIPVLPGIRLAIFIFIFFLSNFILSMSGNAWTSWMTDLVPQERRGRYFGIRNAFVGAVSMVSVFCVGKVYDALKPNIDPKFLYIPFFGIAAVFAVIGIIFFLRKQWEPPLKDEPFISLKETFRLPFTNRNFRRLLVFSALFGTACAFSSPFYQPHMLKNLHMPMTMIACYNLIFQAVSLLTLPLWGRLADRFGNRPVIVVTAFALSLCLIPWLIATPDRIWILWIDASISGICWPGFNLAAFNMLLNTAPQENRTSYFAIHSMTAGFCMCLGSLLGGMSAQYLSHISFTIGNMTCINFHIVFFVTLLGRFMIAPLAMRLHEDNHNTVGTLIDYTTNRIWGIVTDTLQAGVSVIRKITRT